MEAQVHMSFAGVFMMGMLGASMLPVPNPVSAAALLGLSFFAAGTPLG